LQKQNQEDIFNSYNTSKPFTHGILREFAIKKTEQKDYALSNKIDNRVMDNY